MTADQAADDVQAQERDDLVVTPAVQLLLGGAADDAGEEAGTGVDGGRPGATCWNFPIRVSVREGWWS
ncbi:hypothetical protein K7G98_40575, partial [Saccharothrix sp. MB29]|nr:hypothetical protein [Saccharothrix sp. MB29]